MSDWGGGVPDSDPYLSPHACLCVSAQNNSPTWASPVSVPSYQGPSLHVSDSATSLPPPPLPLLPDYQCFPLASAKISSNLSLSCFISAVCRHHVSWRLPPPSYPVFLLQIPSIGLNTTHSATVTLCLSMYASSVWVSASFITFAELL